MAPSRPFGSTRAQGVGASAVAFTGRELDRNGVYYYRARYYDPQVARFSSEDPIDLRSGDVNVYAYVKNNPVGFIDPSVLDTQMCTRPLNDVPWSSSLPPHTLLASTQAKKGAGLAPKEGWDVWMDRPGKIEWEEPYNSDGTVKRGYACTTVSRKQCIEDYVMKRLRQDTVVPPNFRVGQYQCDTDATDVINACEREGGGR